MRPGVTLEIVPRRPSQPKGLSLADKFFLWTLAMGFVLGVIASVVFREVMQ